MKMEAIEQLEEAARKYSGVDEIRLAFWEGAKWYRENNTTLKELRELRNDIEKQTETMDLIKDSDLIQLFGSVTGRLNIIINSEK